MSIIFHCNWPNKTKWIYTLKKKFNREKIYKWPNIYNKEKIKYAIVWNFPKGELKKFKNNIFYGRRCGPSFQGS